MPGLRNFALVAVTLVFITACDGHDKAVSGADIPWFDGDVESAFAAAKEQGKPLFLYWGAEWCPPCHQIKDQIFSKPEFIAKSRLFVPVYLDGDTDRAQKYGDRFGVMGYPTIIVFSPAGVELWSRARCRAASISASTQTSWT